MADKDDILNSESDGKKFTSNIAIVIQGGGGLGPEFQATLDDPVELTYPPPTWDAGMEQELHQASGHTSNYSRQYTASNLVTASDEAMEKGNKADATAMAVIKKPSLTMQARLDEMEERMRAMEEDFESKLYKTQVQLLNVTQLNTALAQALQDYDCKTNSIRDTLEAKVAGLTTEVLQVEAKVNRNSGRIDDLTRVIEDLQEVINTYAEDIGKLQNEVGRVRMSANGNGGQNKMVDTCETGLFISGIQDLKKHFNLPPNIDPARVVGRLMAEVDSYFAIDRIFIADRTAKNRTDSRAAVLYLTTLYHKREVVIRLKTYLSKYPHLRISVNDCFPIKEAPKAMALNRLAYEKRQDQSMTRTRVVNRSGQAILQVANKKGDSYRNVEVDDDELEPYLQQQDQQHGNNKTNSRRRKYKSSNNKQDKESRDQEKADTRKKINGQPNGWQQQQQQSLNSTPSGQRSPAVAMPRGNNSHVLTQQQMGAHPHSSGAGQQMIGASPHLPQQQHLQYYNSSGQMWPPLAFPMAQGGHIYQINTKLPMQMNQKIQYLNPIGILTNSNG